MSVRGLIKEFIDNLKKEHTLFPYLYNVRPHGFDPTKDTIFYSGPVWDDEEAVLGMEAFLTGRWLPSGENVARFEAEFSRRQKLKASVMVNSGSSANLIMIAALKDFFKWPDGGEVVVSTVGFPTTIAPIVQNNLKATFVDITMSDLNFDLSLVEKAITKNTVAVFLSPVLGNPPDMEKLKAICEKAGVMMILDGCDSLGSRWGGKELTELAVSSSCSFYPAHHITTGEGGMVSSNNAELIKVARSYAWWGRDCYCVGAANLWKDGSCKTRFSKWIDGYDGVIDHKYFFTRMGYNVKPLDFQGAIGLAQLKKMDGIHSRRRELKAKIGAMFERNIAGLRVPGELPQAETSWFGVPVICENREQKEKLVDHLESNRIQTRHYFAGNILLHPAYKHLGVASDYPNANKVLDLVFFVGCHPSYTEGMLAHIESTLKTFNK